MQYEFYRKNDRKIKEITEHMKTVLDILEVIPTESNKETPERLARMWVNELFRNINGENISELINEMKLFTEEDTNGRKNLITVNKISFSSTCEHHWLPFTGNVSIGYVPGSKLIGLSKLARVVKYYSQMPQLQERLTNDIGTFLMNYLDPECLFVYVESEHQCMKCRGVEKECITTTMFENKSPIRNLELYDLWRKDFMRGRN